MVVVAGEVDHRDMIRTAEEYFPQPGRDKTPDFQQAVERQQKPQTLFFEKDTEQVHFVVATHALSRYHPDWYAQAVLNMLLGGNMSSRLFEEVREQRGLAYDIRSSVSGYEDTGAFSISAGVETGKTEKTLQVILKELAKMIKKEVPNDELARAKEYLVSQLEMTLEDTMEHALWVGERALYDSHLPHPEEIKTLITKVSAADVRRVDQSMFKTKKINFTLIGRVQDKDQQRIRRSLEI
jgi:predicted Zn-dependent peptidase